MKLVSVQEMAEMAGISGSWIYKRMGGSMPVFRAGRRIRINPDEWFKWLRHGDTSVVIGKRKRGSGKLTSDMRSAILNYLKLGEPTQLVMAESLGITTGTLRKYEIIVTKEKEYYDRNE